VNVAAIVERILGERLDDGGWNCEAENGSVRSSFDTTTEVLDGLLEFAFPYYWRYDALRALDCFRRSGADPDPRMAEAVEVVRSKRQPDGRWLLDRIHPGRVHFDFEGGVGTPSRWNTLRAPCARLVGRRRLTRPPQADQLRVGCRAACEAGANVGRRAWAGALARFDGRSVEDDQQQR
jgi:hypothetical protein